MRVQCWASEDRTFQNFSDKEIFGIDLKENIYNGSRRVPDDTIFKTLHNKEQ
jgi:hypothetical protein